jgi:hypothetical protein
MAEVIAYRHPDRPLVLTFDTDDVESVQIPRDHSEVPCDAAGCPGCAAIHRQLGRAHLNLTFKDGKQPLWKEAG